MPKKKKQRAHITSSGIKKVQGQDKVKKAEERRKKRSELFLKLKGESKEKGLNTRKIRGQFGWRKLRMFLAGKSYEEINQLHTPKKKTIKKRKRKKGKKKYGTSRRS